MKIRVEAAEPGDFNPLMVALEWIRSCTPEGPVDPAEAYERERAAIRSGDVIKAARAPDATVVTRGVLGLLGSPYQSDVQAGLFLISSKADHDPLAQLAFGLQCVHGANMPADFQRGETLLTRAKEGAARSSPAWRNASLGLAVLQMLTERHAQGLQTFEELATQEGDADAAYLAGVCHRAEAYAGRREADFSKSIDFLHLAVARDHRNAMRALAELLQDRPNASEANRAEGAAWHAWLGRLETASLPKPSRRKSSANSQVA